MVGKGDGGCVVACPNSFSCVLNVTFQRSAGQEAHEHLGKGDHHGGLLKQIAKKCAVCVHNPVIHWKFK